MADVSVRKTDKVIVQVGTNLGPRADCDIVSLSKQEESDLAAAFLTPNGGIRLNADGSFTALPVPAAPVDPNAADKATLKTVASTNWALLTPVQKDDALRILLKLYGG